MEPIGRAPWRLVEEVANADGRLPFTEADSTALPADFGKRMRERMGGNRVRLGVSTGEPDPDGGLPVEHVLEGGPADSAGILDGDLLLAIGETPLRSRADLTAALANLKRGESARLRIRRGAEERWVEVRFPAGSASSSPGSRPARRDS